MTTAFAERSAPAWWRSRWLWLSLWLAGTVALGVALVWDARPWLTSAPQASFRYTYLAQWPMEIIWWLLVPGILWLQNSLTRLDRHWPWAVSLHSLMAALITGLFI